MANPRLPVLLVNETRRIRRAGSVTDVGLHVHIDVDVLMSRLTRGRVKKTRHVTYVRQGAAGPTID